MNIAEILRSHAQQHPSDLALLDQRRGGIGNLTYRQLECESGRLATLLRRSGLLAGDTVLVFYPMSSELYITLAALFRLGLVAMFADPAAGRHYLDRCCELRPPQAIIAGSRAQLLRLVSPPLRRIPLNVSIGLRIPGAKRWESARKLPSCEDVCPCDSDYPALVSFTSGSNGQPKMTLRTHGFLRAQHRAIARNLALVAGEIELVALPVFVLANLASRVTSIIPDADLRRPDSIRPGPVVAQLQRHGATRIAAPPAFYERLVEYCERHGVVLPQLTKVFTGGGPVSTRLLKRLERVAPRAAITAVYGATEAEPISTVTLTEMHPSDFSQMLGGQGLLAGCPVPGLEVRIVPDQCGLVIGPYSPQQFDRLCLGPGAVGEIVVCGEHVLSTFSNCGAPSHDTIQVGSRAWHRTGDAGFVDESGRLWLQGRCAAQINDRRGSLYPLGAEQAALRFDSVRRAALVSLNKQRLLVVEFKPNCERQNIPALIQSLSFAQVDAVRIVKRLPVDKRHNAKVDYVALRRLLS